MAGRKNHKKDYATAQLLNFAQDSYLERTSRPVYAIAFLLPFIIFYELGTILINTDILNQVQVRVVAFVWLQNLLRHLGTGSRFAWIAPPMMAIIILVGLQLASKKPWYFCLGDYTPMVCECVCLAVPLIILSLLFNSSPVNSDLSAQLDGVAPQILVCSAPQAGCPPGGEGGEAVAKVLAAGGPPQRSLMADVITGVGAGIYEELVFRLILICVLMVLFQDLIGLGHQNAVVLSVMISAALFSAHHHIIWVDGQLGRSAPFLWTEFGFRTIAGVYFALLFAIRGFGITAGTHAFYDIIATVMNALFFAR
ncbi:MAG TPA: CPBP family intramembrane glutamic endopeptidase [Sedimentisphaerales bacterium]|nr:CPBP family intramembrane glutamic endopeptidase [Sedimentisphaerales bacterium]